MTPFVTSKNRPVRQIGEEFEADADFRIFSFAFHRQTETEKTIVESTLGGFEFRPGYFVTIHGEIRDGSRQAARDTEAGTAQLQRLWTE